MRTDASLSRLQSDPYAGQSFNGLRAEGDEDHEFRLPPWQAPPSGGEGHQGWARIELGGVAILLGTGGGLALDSTQVRHPGFDRAVTELIRRNLAKISPVLLRIDDATIDRIANSELTVSLFELAKQGQLAGALSLLASLPHSVPLTNSPAPQFALDFGALHVLTWWKWLVLLALIIWASLCVSGQVTCGSPGFPEGLCPNCKQPPGQGPMPDQKNYPVGPWKEGPCPSPPFVPDVTSTCGKGNEKGACYKMCNPKTSADGMKTGINLSMPAHLRDTWGSMRSSAAPVRSSGRESHLRVARLAVWLVAIPVLALPACRERSFTAGQDAMSEWSDLPQGAFVPGPSTNASQAHGSGTIRWTLPYLGRVSPDTRSTALRYPAELSTIVVPVDKNKVELGRFLLTVRAGQVKHVILDKELSSGTFGATAIAANSTAALWFLHNDDEKARRAKLARFDIGGPQTCTNEFQTPSEALAFAADGTLWTIASSAAQPEHASIAVVRADCEIELEKDAQVLSTPNVALRAVGETGLVVITPSGKGAPGYGWEVTYRLRDEPWQRLTVASGTEFCREIQADVGADSLIYLYEQTPCPGTGPSNPSTPAVLRVWKIDLVSRQVAEAQLGSPLPVATISPGLVPGFACVVSATATPVIPQICTTLWCGNGTTQGFVPLPRSSSLLLKPTGGYATETIGYWVGEELVQGQSFPGRPTILVRTGDALALHEVATDFCDNNIP